MKFIIFLILVVLLVGILYFDFWVYRIFVLNIELHTGEDGTEKLFLLKTPLLEKAAEEIRKKDDFVASPKYTLIKDPF